MRSKKRTFQVALIGLCIGLFVRPETASGVAVLRVDRTVTSTCGASCDGSDWTAAHVYTYIQDALLDVTSNGTQIWVATGTYYPHEQSCADVGDCADADSCDEEEDMCVFTNPEDKTFNLTSPYTVKMYGGFEGDEDYATERDFGCYDPSVLDSEQAYDEASCTSKADCEKTCTVDADCPLGDTCESNKCDRTCSADEDCGPGNSCVSTKCEWRFTGKVCALRNETILSGDIDSDDGGTCEDDGDCGSTNYCLGEKCIKGGNSFHVVTYDTASAAAVLNGFVVTYGMADGNGPGAFGVENQGGGLQIREPFACDSSSSNPGELCDEDDDCTGGDCESPGSLTGGPTVEHCVFRRNYAADHGAVNDHATASSYDECAFHNNRAGNVDEGRDSVPETAGKGAALLVDNGAAVISNCVFLENHTVDKAALNSEGGALWTDNASLTVDDCEFLSNLGYRGGALYTGTSLGPTIADCHFHENGRSDPFGGFSVGAFYGGAVYGKGTFNDCLFTANEGNYSPAFWGSGTINRCRFEGNIEDGGYGSTGTIYSDGPLSIWNTVIVNNTADKGAAVFAAVGDVEITNCTIVDNKNNWAGEGTLHVAGSSNMTLFNTIVWDNDGDWKDSSTGEITACYSIFKADPPGGKCDTSAPDNIFMDPLLVDDNFPVFDLKLQDGSPAIDGGCKDDLTPDKCACTSTGCVGCADGADVGTKDRDGVTRVQSGLVDIGAYESDQTTDCVVEGDLCCTSLECSPNKGNGCVFGFECCDIGDLAGKCCDEDNKLACDPGESAGEGECVKCTDDTYCSPPLHCETTGHTCVNCTQDNHCFNAVCDLTSYGCIVCEDDNTYPTADHGCGGSTKVCDDTVPTCRVCLDDTVDGIDEGCPDAPDQACDATVPECVECTVDGDCGGGTPACRTATNTCVECTSTNQEACTGGTPVCWTGARLCVECVNNGHCDPGEVCCVAGHTCQPSCGGGGPGGG